MSDLIIAVLIVILSQYILKAFIEPFVEFKKVMGEVSYQMLLNQSKIVSSPEANKELALTLKHLSASLLPSVNSILGYPILRILSLNKLPSKRDVKEASRNINLLYYNVLTGNKDYAEIENSLKLIADFLNVDTSYS